MSPVDSLPLDRIAELCREFEVKELSVFGSFLRDDFRNDSDIDFLVLFQQGARIGFIRLGLLEERLSALVHRKVDLVPKNGLNLHIRESVINTTMVVYAQ